MPEAAPAPAETPITIGLLADAQYADIPPSPTRFYRQSLGKLREALDWIGPQRPDFVVHVGDLVDRHLESFAAPLDILGTLKVPVHQVPGNHDFEVKDDEKARVPALLGCTKRWRSFARGPWRFVFLDTNLLSTYAWPAGSPEAAEGRRALDALKAAKAPYANDWNGGLGPAQRQWLEDELESATAASQRAIVFAHHPVYPHGPHDVLDQVETSALLDKHAGVVAAWINGHNHDGAYEARRGIHFLTLHGMVETEHSNACGLLRVYPGRLEIDGRGREPSRRLALG